MSSAAPLHSLPLFESSKVTFSPDGGMLAVSFRQRIALLDSKAGRLISQPVPENVYNHMRFSPDGRTFAVRDWDHQIARVSLVDGDFTVDHTLIEDEISRFEFSPCSKLIVAANAQGYLSVIELASGDYVWGDDEECLVADYAYTPQRDMWVTAHHCDAEENTSHEDRLTEFRVWSWPLDTATSRVLPYRVTGFHRVVLSPAADMIAVLFEKNRKVQLQVYSLARDMILHAQPAVGDPAPVLEWSPCGRYLAYGTHHGAGVGVLDFVQRREIFDLVVGRVSKQSVGDWPHELAFSPDGSRLAIGAKNGCVVTLNAEPKGSPTRTRV